MIERVIAANFAAISATCDLFPLTLVFAPGLPQGPLGAAGATLWPGLRHDRRSCAVWMRLVKRQRPLRGLAVSDRPER